jgi:hypothetical protein
MRPLHKTVCSLHVWLVLACGLAPASLVLAQGTIAYYQPPQPLFVLGRMLDINRDEQADVQFYDASNYPLVYGATKVSGVGTARLLVLPHVWMADGGSSLMPLPAGFLIGPNSDPSLLWAAQNAGNAYGAAFLLGAYDPETVGGGLVPIGPFYDTTAFMGIHFQIGTDWHYGWVRIRGGTAGPSEDGQQFYLNPPAWVLDWAYEARPDTPIFAGAVPEPSTLALLLGGGFLMVWFRQKRNETRG